MKIEVKEWSAAALKQYSTIPIAFEVNEVFDPVTDGTNGEEFTLKERRLIQPYVKDYDAIAGEHPSQWPTRFDVSYWGLLIAVRDGQWLGGVVIAWKTPGLSMLEGRTDLAVIWDIRVAHDARRHGIGSKLLHAAEEWALSKGCREIKIETQNINVPACKFYKAHGYLLTAVNSKPYERLPDETQLIWSKTLPHES
jgi:ribosomal protein S18 acetylase RimI-like enzyme